MPNFKTSAPLPPVNWDGDPILEAPVRIVQRHLGPSLPPISKGSPLLVRLSGFCFCFTEVAHIDC